MPYENGLINALKWNIIELEDEQLATGYSLHSIIAVLELDLAKLEYQAELEVAQLVSDQRDRDCARSWNDIEASWNAA